MITTQRDKFIQFIKSNAQVDPWLNNTNDAARYKYRRQAMKMTVRDGDRLFIDGREVIAADRIDDIVKEAYSDPASGFVSPLRLFHRLREKYANITLNDVKRVVHGNETYQKHRRAYKMTGRSNTQGVNDVLSMIEIDLIGPLEKPGNNLSLIHILLVVSTDIFRPAVEQGKINELISLKFKEQAKIELTKEECDHIAQYFRMLVDIM